MKASRTTTFVVSALASMLCLNHMHSLRDHLPLKQRAIYESTLDYLGYNSQEEQTHQETLREGLERVVAKRVNTSITPFQQGATGPRYAEFFASGFLSLGIAVVGCGYAIRKRDTKSF